MTGSVTPNVALIVLVEPVNEVAKPSVPAAIFDVSLALCALMTTDGMAGAPLLVDVPPTAVPGVMKPPHGSAGKA